MTDETTELLPCPFCGASGYVAEHNHGYYPTAKHDRNCPMAQMSFPESEFYIKPEFAVESWNTRTELGSRTLTAEQVRKCVRVGACDHGLWGALDEDTDWQVIANELNAELWSGTCHAIAIYNMNDEWCSDKCSACDYEWYEDEPNFCPNCGRKVVSA